MPDAASPTHADWIERARTIRPPTRPFINGDYRAPMDGAVVVDTTPRDGSAIAEVETAGARDVDRAVEAAREAFEDGRWADRAPVERKRVLLRFADLIRANADELALLESSTWASPIHDATRVDVPAPRLHPVVRGGGGQALRRGRADGAGRADLVTREPFGVVAALVPWNYPLIISRLEARAGARDRELASSSSPRPARR